MMPRANHSIVRLLHRGAKRTRACHLNNLSAPLPFFSPSFKPLQERTTPRLNITRSTTASSGQRAKPTDEQAGERHSKFNGVTYEPDQIKPWRARLSLADNEIDGGLHWTEEDAARAYDDLARMFLGADAQVNYSDSESPSPELDSAGSTEEAIKLRWRAPGSSKSSWFTLKPRVELTADEVVHALEMEAGDDINVLNLKDRSHLADYMIFVTGKSALHMRRMADMIVAELKARGIKPMNTDPIVEGRNCDDWMIVDAGNIIVQIMDEETRRDLNLEDHWSKMRMGEDMHAHLTQDDFERLYPMPEVDESEFVVGDEETFDPSTFEEDDMAPWLKNDEDWLDDEPSASSEIRSSEKIK